MTAAWGDEIYFRIPGDTCTRLPGVSFFEFTGGTGRFVDAHGTISQFLPGSLLPGVPSISMGTVSVRADLWADPSARRLTCSSFG